MREEEEKLRGGNCVEMTEVEERNGMDGRQSLQSAAHQGRHWQDRIGRASKG